MPYLLFQTLPVHMEQNQQNIHPSSLVLSERLLQTSDQWPSLLLHSSWNCQSAAICPEMLIQHNGVLCTPDSFKPPFLNKEFLHFSTVNIETYPIYNCCSFNTYMSVRCYIHRASKEISYVFHLLGKLLTCKIFCHAIFLWIKLTFLTKSGYK